MTLAEMHPFLRFSGHSSAAVLGTFMRPLRACDHRLFVCENGNCIFRVDGKEYRAQTGTVLLFCAGTLYEYTAFSDDFSMFSFNFDMTQMHADKSFPIPPDKAELFRQRSVLESEDEYPRDDLGDVLYTVDAEALTIAARIEREYRHGALFHQVRTSHMLADLIALAARSAMRRDMPKAARLVSLVTSYIREHYSEACDNATISAEFSYHPNYINRLMVDHTGMSLHQYVNRTRISHAQILLEGGQYTVSEVGMMVGFSDLSHFSKTFRKFVGLSPAQYSARGE